MTLRTVLDFYRHDTESPRSRHYVRHTPEGRTSFSTNEFFSQMTALAEALSDQGIGAGDRVMLLSDNRPEWHMADLAVLSLGAADVPVYGTLTTDQIAYQVRDSGARAAIVDSAEQMAKFVQIKDRCPDLKLLIQIDGERDDGVTGWEDMIMGGSIRRAGDRFWDRAATIDEDSLMTLIYTSGTTGEPKGVMLTHRNLVQNVRYSADRIPVDRTDLALEFLPLCHVLERMIGYIYMWRATFHAYCSVHHVGDLVGDIRPTLFAGVPRFYEKVQQKIMDKVAGSGALKRALFHWALDVGREHSRHRITGKNVSAMLERRYRLADNLVLSKVREGLGGRIRFAISGGAELPMHVNEFFHSLGVTIMEGYGLTETSPVIAVNGAKPGELRLGTVGKPLTNLAIKLAEDGELCVKGPSVMQGYWNKEEQTAEVFDEEGFFHTGDIAEVDGDGFVLIIDRKKDLIVTAGGKNIAPQPIESQIKHSPFVEAVVLIGDRRPFLVALFSPAVEELERWAKANKIEFTDHEELTSHAETQQLFADIVERQNAVLARFEQIKQFRILAEPLTVEGGHLTPTLKVKRRVVEEQFAHLVKEMYS
ncbi:MAG: long-chain fatty acid--CoA ligase [Thermoanaerobaculales bacterium]|nr:long-chain fatty acid--CoA ligase [Thermoanaerobaculales bacterium]